MLTWHYTFPAPRTTQLRPLLSQDWWLPSHLVHALRVHRRVLVNGTYRPMNTVVQPGEVIDMTFNAADFAHPVATVDPDSAATVAVLYESADLLVVNKTRGAKTHPNQPGEVGTTLNHIAAYLGADALGPYILNRLDQETSGVLMVAKSPVVVPLMVRAIAAKRVQRTYLAWVHGPILADAGTFQSPIGRDPNDQRKRQVNGLNAQSAITHWRVLDRLPQATKVAVQLETGRTHQIRVHFASSGHPLVGDPLYACDAPHIRLRLHAWQLTFPLPFNQGQRHVTAPVPGDFDQGMTML